MSIYCYANLSGNLCTLDSLKKQLKEKDKLILIGDTFHGNLLVFYEINYDKRIIVIPSIEDKHFLELNHINYNLRTYYWHIDKNNNHLIIGYKNFTIYYSPEDGDIELGFNDILPNVDEWDERLNNIYILYPHCPKLKSSNNNHEIVVYNKLLNLDEIIIKE